MNTTLKVPVIFFCVLAAFPAFASTHKRTFAEDCDTVWQASMQVAKGTDYQVVSISKEEKIISVQPATYGSLWTGERTITLTIEPDKHGCAATATNHGPSILSDGPDLLVRVHVLLVGQEIGIGMESPAFQKYKRCVENYNSSETKCEAQLRRRLAAEGRP
jgi:hypothetical protein